MFQVGFFVGSYKDTQKRIHSLPAEAIFSASGLRSSSSGGLNGLGSYGYTWSGSPISAASVGGSDLAFNSSVVHPEVDNGRSSGFPVRCVQE